MAHPWDFIYFSEKKVAWVGEGGATFHARVILKVSCGLLSEGLIGAMDFNVTDEASRAPTSAHRCGRQALTQFRLKGWTGITRPQARRLSHGEGHGPCDSRSGACRLTIEDDGAGSGGQTDYSAQDAYPAARHGRDDVPIRRRGGDADYGEFCSVMDIAPVGDGLLLAGQL